MTQRQTKSIVDGVGFVSSSNTWYDIQNPATGEVVARVPESTPAELAAASASAAKAFKSWSEVSVQQRARVMMRFQALLNQHKDEIAALITEEQGKTLADAHGDLYRGIEVVEHRCTRVLSCVFWEFVCLTRTPCSISMPSLILGEYAENVTQHTDLYTIKQPLGVTAAICPFNFPGEANMFSVMCIALTSFV